MRKLCSAASGLLFAASLTGLSSAAERGIPSIRNAAISSNSITLEFSEPMITWAGSGLAPGISTEPAVACNWYWSDELHLACDADWRARAIRPATRYRVALHDGPWSQLGKQLADQVLLIESGRPTVKAEISGWRDGRPLIDVTTNVEATTDALASVLSVHLADGSALPFKLRVAKDANRPWYGEQSKWRIELAEKPAHADVLTLHVNPGLRAIEGELPGVQQEDLLHVVFDEPFALRLVGCSASRRGWQTHASRVGNNDQVAIDCPAGEQVSLEFSDAPTQAALAQLRRALPAGLRLEEKIEHAYSYYGSDPAMAARPGHFLRLTSERARQSLSFDVPETLENDAGAHLARAIHVTVDIGDFLPGIAIGPPKLLLPTGADTPAIFAGVNLPAVRLLQRSLGGDARRTVRHTLDFGTANEKTIRTPPDPPRDVRNSGGFINGNTNGATEAAFNDSWSDYTIAYSAFNITTSFADPQFLVWVTDWDHAGAIAGAKVELLRTSIAGDVHVLTSAITGEDGIAAIDRPEEIGNPQQNGILLLRATRDRKRSILPLIQSLRESRDAEREYHSNEIDERQQLAWGVTDKPLYRPGETVHYRVWLRERHRNHLLVPSKPPPELELTSLAQDHVIRRIQVAPDAFGSVDGELHLPDNTTADDYCIRVPRQGWMTGACFRVTGYHTNDTWAELKADRELARSGDTVMLDASAGYYSGGPAVDAKAEIQSLLSPMQLQDAYPAFREYTFIDPWEGTAGAGGESFRHQEPEPERARTDAGGHARIAIALNSMNSKDMPPDLRPIPFGNIEFTVSVSPTPNSGSTSAPVSMRFSRYPRFVGFKLPPGLLRGDEDPRVEAVVVSAAGDALDRVPVHIVIDEPESGSDSAPPNPPLATCDIVSGMATACPFRAPHSGWYRFHASSEGAADAKIEQYALVGGTRAPEDIGAKLIIAESNVRAGETTMLTLQQPFARGRALLTVEHGGVLAHWVQDVGAQVVTFPLRVEADWAPGATIHATVLDAGSPAFGDDASQGSLVATASVDLKVPRTPGGGVALTLERAQARPGEEVGIRLENNSGERRQITLSVVDDAARALVPDIAANADPLGPSWLGALSYWRTPQWSALGAWPRHAGAAQRLDALPFSYPVYDFRDPNDKLDTITVTGSNIRAADVFVRNAAGDHSLGKPARGGVALAHLRSRFVESALWKTDIVLEAGEHRDTTFRLPDNLTRWRASAWSTSVTDGFGMSEATIEAALPIEVRADVPSRLFPGDVTTLAASVRNHTGAPVPVEAAITATGAGVDGNASLRQSIAANATRQLSLPARADAIGEIAIEARAKGGSATDGVGATVEVASPIVAQQLPVAGWLPPEGAQLHLPILPAGATHPRLRIQAGRGLLVLADGWIDVLRDYPHRCWEQVLSRAVGAAAATRLGIGSRWKDSERVVRDALETAGQYQESDGQFRFFAGEFGQGSAPDLYLTAYTVRAFAFLRELGYAIPADIDKRARESLAGAVATPSNYPHRFADIAAALAELEPGVRVPTLFVDRLWNARAKLDWFARANLAQALANREPDAERTRTALAELRGAGASHGMRRSIDPRTNSGWVFASTALEQCGVVGTLAQLDHASDAEPVRREYLRGLVDLYAGGSPNLDTQATAQCLMALVHAKTMASNAPIRVEAGGGEVSASVDVAAGQPTAEWVGTVAQLPPQITLRSNASENDLVTFVATVEYDADGRRSDAAATAFGIERRYSVLRDRAWKDVPAATIHEGDWVRVTLRLSSHAVRHYVAITDTVAGGLQPTDLELAGVAGLDLRALGGDGSGYFSSRRIDDRFARFYAEQLPPGVHDVYYYARATHAGHYAALPAIAELMYGSAGVARTASTVLDVLEGKR